MALPGSKMTTKRSKICDAKFRVLFNAARRTFDIGRNGRPTGSSAKDKHTAIDLASRAAQFDNREGKTAVVYTTNAGGKQVVEWSARRNFFKAVAVSHWSTL